MLSKEEDTLSQKAEDLEVLTRNLKIIPKKRRSELHQLTRISKTLFNYVPSSIAEPLGLVHNRVNQKKRQNLGISYLITVLLPFFLWFIVLQVYLSNPLLSPFSPPLESQLISVLLIVIMVYCLMSGMHSMGHLLTSKAVRIDMLGAYPKFFGLFWVWEVNHEDFLEAGARRRIYLYFGGLIGTLASPIVIWVLLGLEIAVIALVFLFILELVGYVVGFFTDLKKVKREVQLYRKFRKREREK
ncbi:MAG: hypothetical protein ACW976_06885 [Candidatus Ranarchaeia archaeon]